MVNKEGSFQCLMQIFTTWKRKLSPFFGCCGFLYSLSKPGWTGDHNFCEVGDWASIIKWPTSRLDRLQDWTETELHLQSIITDYVCTLTKEFNQWCPPGTIEDLSTKVSQEWLMCYTIYDGCCMHWWTVTSDTETQASLKVFAHSTDYVYTLMIVLCTQWNLINRLHLKSGHSCDPFDPARHLPNKETTLWLKVVWNGCGSTKE